MRPLEGITVLDLTRLLPGPFCTWLLRSWGARVIKVEDPEVGDYLRELQPVWFEQLNAGAESLALDLKQPAGRRAFLRLAASVDAVIEGFRPGVMERLGIGYGALKEVNPNLVLVSVSGFPADDERAARAGHDITYLARSGLLSLMGEVPPVQIADMTAGLMAAAGALAGVVGALRSGRGSHVEVSLLDSLFALGAIQVAETRAGSPPVRERMVLGGAIGPYNLYRTADGGRVALGALEAKFWSGFCAAVGRPDLVERYFDPAVKDELAALFGGRTLAQWCAFAREHDVCIEPVLSMTEAVQEHPRVQPVRFDGVRPALEGGAPSRGQHNDRLFEEFGLREQEL